MTELAKKIKLQLDAGKDAEQILAIGLGDSDAEVEFIIEQLRHNG
tara:strand:+ start:1253 stop:1387 length:135 start_codon:yes stop_codon:yes gene_type:complete